MTPSDGGAATAFAYDGNGNQTSRTDASGVTRYVYGADDRLAGVALPGGGGSAYEYDANGLRVKKADSTGTTRYLLDGLSVVGQYGADGGRQAFYVQSLARIDEVLSVVNGQGKHWYQADALGSVYTLTTAAGEVRARGGYDVFGAPVAESGAAVGQPFGFTGREHELESGLVYARARYLSPFAGSWTSPDPLTWTASVNGGAVADTSLETLASGSAIPSDDSPRYRYVAARPTVAADPSGLLLVYMGGTGTFVSTSIGTTYGVGAVLGFGGPRGFTMGVALTFGVIAQLAKMRPLNATGPWIPVNVSAGGEFGIYWGKDEFGKDLADACDYAGPFASLAADLYFFGFGLVWSVNSRMARALRRLDPVMFMAALEWPVGMTLSKGWSFVPGAGVTAAVTTSRVLGAGCGCRS